MIAWAALRYRLRLWTTRPRRYANLFRTIHERRCRSLVEIGTWDGAHAEQMVRVAALQTPIAAIRYRGFDLFEDLSDELYEREFSKRPPSRDAVLARLRRTGADVELFKGNTRVTLPAAAEQLRRADFVFIDGGHSLETVRSDWRAVEAAMHPGMTVIFDDYYHHPAPALAGLGCQTVVDALDRSTYHVELLDPVDSFNKTWGPLHVGMVRVRRR